MKKILHINDYPADNGGGAEVVMKRTIELLREQGLVVETFTMADLADRHRTPWQYLDNSGARNALAARLVSFRPQVVHLHNYYHHLSPGILTTLDDYKQQRPLRVVMTAHDYHLACPNSGGSWFHWWSGRREVIQPQRLTSLGYLLTRAWDHRSCFHSFLKLVQHAWHYRWRQRQRVIDRVICPSRFVQKMLRPCGLKTRWLPHPVPLPISKVRDRTGALCLVFAGRLEPEKGLYEFLQALPANFDATLTIIGAGSERARCERLCVNRSWTGHVQFYGRLEHEETLARIAEAHVLVQPSRVLETYGLTLIEALAVGTNVLASDRGASREIVEDGGVGFLYDVESPVSLAAALQAIQHRHLEGTLNRFHLAELLEQRSETAYIDGLLRHYENSEDDAEEDFPDAPSREDPLAA